MDDTGQADVDERLVAIALEPESDQDLGKRRVLYAITAAALTVIVGLALVDAVGWWPAYGVDSGTAHASGGGYDLSVRYGRVSRPGLATPIEIRVHRPGGFEGEVTLAVTLSYLRVWDFNELYPEPSSMVSQGDWVEWEFDPPAGDDLVVWLDGRLEPANQRSRAGSIAVVDDGRHVAEVHVETKVRP
jgi:hypothetical protein